MIYPEEMKRECLICGKSITYPFPLCAEHFEEYGDKPREWDPWLRDMWNNKQKRRRDVIKSTKNEVSLEMLGEEYPNLT